MSLTPTTNPSEPYTCSITGKVRDHNEDSVLAKQWSIASPGPLGIQSLLAVADGMGGHHGGEWASATAIEAFQSSLALAAAKTDIRDSLIDAVKKTNQVVYFGCDKSGTEHPGTTLTVAAIKLQSCEVAHVGDSRLYLLRHGELHKVTEDDTWAQELVNKGDMSSAEAEKWAYRNQLTKAIGVAADIVPSTYSFELFFDDILLLCSDGLTGMLSDNEIRQVISQSRSIVQAGEALCATANAAGGEDNISVVLYCHGKWNPALPPPITRNQSRRVSAPHRPSNDVLNRTISTQPRPPRSRTWLIRSSLVLVALLLGAGIRFTFFNPQKQQPSATTVAHKTTSAHREAARLNVVFDKATGALRLLSDGASFMQIVDQPQWRQSQGAVGEYTFKYASKSIAMLKEQRANLVLLQPDCAEVILHKATPESMTEWFAPLASAGEYRLFFRVAGSTDQIIACFSVLPADNKEGGAGEK